MGEEIQSSHFRDEDFAEFHEHLAEETDLLEVWLESGAFSNEGGVGGYELEAWLVDRDGHPAPANNAFLERLGNPMVVPELATFNVELNADPLRLEGDVLSRMHESLTAAWQGYRRVAADLDMRLVTVGILPTVRKSDLTLEHMSPLKRYRALNEQIFRLRDGNPIQLRIDGIDPLDVLHHDVMLESAATSFQIHLQTSIDEAADIYDASRILSAPLVAATANSPFLFGHRLWEETRIPLFEQAVSVGGSSYGGRVTFGHRYVKHSVFDCFRVNRDHFPVLLPRCSDDPPDRMTHLRLHNGTIWRWNRPLIGFDRDGRPHLRIEHRVMPAGPTLTDMIANAALYFGAATALAQRLRGNAAARLPFEDARQNFYAAARRGLDTEVTWLDGASGPVRDLLEAGILPEAAEGLRLLGVDDDEAAHWLGVIRERIRSGRTGAWWQQAWVERHGFDAQALTAAYLERQESDDPVHSWDLD